MVVTHGKKEGTLYLTNNSNSSIAVANKDINSNTWPSSEQERDENPRLKSLDLEVCEDCVFKEKKKVTFLKANRPLESERLELVHTDVLGQTKVPSFGGSSYFLTLIDDATRKLWVYRMKHKSHVFGVLKKWKAMVENEIGLKLNCLRSNNGGEYSNKE